MRRRKNPKVGRLYPVAVYFTQLAYWRLLLFPYKPTWHDVESYLRPQVHPDDLHKRIDYMFRAIDVVAPFYVVLDRNPHTTTGTKFNDELLEVRPLNIQWNAPAHNDLRMAFKRLRAENNDSIDMMFMGRYPSLVLFGPFRDSTDITAPDSQLGSA